MKLNVKKISEKANLPLYAHPGDAGMDLCSIGEYTIKPGETMLVKTGIAIELPYGYEAQIRPRSGLALKNGVTVLNTPGTIDAGYRGEIGVILINHSKNNFEITEGAKIAQMVICAVSYAEIEEICELSISERNDKGFGSSGV